MHCQPNQLTICSVSFHSGLHLAANYELTREINGDVRWVVAQNGPLEDLPRFVVIPGAAAEVHRRRESKH